MITTTGVLMLIGIGLLAGVLGGMLGVGGSVIMIPGMVFAIPRGQQHLFQAAAMLVNVFVAAPAAVHHWVRGTVLRPVARFLIPAALTGVIVGVALSNTEYFQGENSDRLAKVFAGLLAYVTLYYVYRVIRNNRLPEMTQELSSRIPPWRVIAVGSTFGLAAGLTGIGGGALAVPMQQVFLRIPLKNAIANSACTIVFSAIIGSIYKNGSLYLHHIPISDSLIVALAMTPSAFIGGWMGARLTTRLPRQPVRAVFIAMLVIGIWRMWTAELPAAPASMGKAVAPTNQPTTASAPENPGGR